MIQHWLNSNKHAPPSAAGKQVMEPNISLFWGVCDIKTFGESVLQFIHHRGRTAAWLHQPCAGRKRTKKGFLFLLDESHLALTLNTDQARSCAEAAVTRDNIFVGLYLSYWVTGVCFLQITNNATLCLLHVTHTEHLTLSRLLLQWTGMFPSLMNNGLPWKDWFWQSVHVCLSRSTGSHVQTMLKLLSSLQ